MADDFGLAKGLAYRNDSSGIINDYRHHDMQMQQNKALASAKAALFADSVSYNNAANAFDNQKIREHNDPLIRQIGKYYKENPDTLYNPDKLVQLNEMKRRLKDNEHVLRGAASDANFKALNADLQEVAKNPQMHDQQAYQDLLAQKENYLKYGNQLGLEASQKEGYKPFVYTKPQDFVDLPEVYRKMGSSMKARGFADLNNGRDGAFKTFATEEDLKNVASEIYTKNKRQLDQELTSKGIDPIQEGMKRLQPHVPTEYHIGEKNRLGEQMALAKYTDALKRAGEGGAKGGSYYNKTIKDTDWVRPPAEKLAETFGSTPRHFLPNGNGGAPIDNTGDIFHYEGDIYDKGYRTDGKYKKTGVKVADGFVIKPTTFGVDAGYLYDPNGRSGDPALKGTDYEDYEIKPEFKKLVSFIDTPIDKNGKSEKALKVKTQAEFDSNDPYYRGKWDDNLLTTKQKDALGVDTEGTYQGHPIGSVINTTAGKFLVTANGYVPQ